MNKGKISEERNFEEVDPDDILRELETSDDGDISEDIFEDLKKEKVTAVIIGDTHFKHTEIQEGNQLISSIINYLLGLDPKPDFIVCLGDTLDTHEIVRTQPLNMVNHFFSELRKIAPIFVLIGNHDLINASQFMTKNHPFNSFKEWDNVTIVDYPFLKEIGGLDFIFCPFVPNGRFIESLNSKLKNSVWSDPKEIKCIFAHQEFRGCTIGTQKSDKGDVWNPEYPPVISGHIHEEQTLGNVYYPGTPIQQNFGEKQEKNIWKVDFWTDKEGFEVTKHNVNVKPKKTITFNLSENTLDEKTLTRMLNNEMNKYKLQIKLIGKSPDFVAFRKSNLYKIIDKKVRVTFESLESEKLKTSVSLQKQSSFQEILIDIVNKKNEHVRNLFAEISA